MNERIRRLNLVVTGLFLLIILNLTYLQLLTADKIAARTENKRAELSKLLVEPGVIYSADGLVLARPVKKGQFYYHQYPEGELAAHVIGFYSPRYGKMGLGKSYESVLFPGPDVSYLDQLFQLPGEKRKGGTLILTIDSALQKKAEEILKGHRGAVVALDPKTGRILSLVSSPGFNPNLIEVRWLKINEDLSKPLFNRALQGLYPPGSTFKIITAAAALESGAALAETVYDGPAELKVDGGRVTNFRDQGFGTMTMREAFARSCNTIFAQIGLQLGDKTLTSMAERFGFNSSQQWELPTKSSQIPLAGQMDQVELAWTAVGQGRVLVTPLQMALAGAVVANNGVMMKPFLVQKTADAAGKPLKETRPAVWKRVITAQTAAELSKLMEEVVQKGTGRRAAVSGVRIAGKTGTAETPTKKNHAWFVGFAPADSPRIVVVVMIEEGGLGGKIAAPLAGELIEAYLSKGEQ